MATVAEVAVAAPLDKTLSYKVPEELIATAIPGVRVRVPLGRRTATGYLLAIAEGSIEGLKPIKEILDTERLFASGWTEFIRKAAAYYRYPLGEACRTALPAGLAGKGSDVRILHEKVYTALPGEDSPSGRKQQQLLALIREKGEVELSELRSVFNAPYAALERLQELGLISVRDIERSRDPFRDVPIIDETEPVPDTSQQVAIDALLSKLRENSFAAALLHGVTGSGKTEVYLRLIAETVAAGRQALVLVPEIALTPQLVSRFRSRFAHRNIVLAVLHSGLSDGERYDAWRSIARDEVQIVIGARSAVFAPCDNLGVIVVDEEHESSYKQSEGFRYNARDLALLRGQAAGSLVLLGSATPSLPVYRRACGTDEMLYLPLSGRVAGRKLPDVEMIDMREQEACGALSPPMLEALGHHIERGEQVLLLLNRRGFAPYLICSDCGFGLRCPNCAITLTYHQSARKLLCHYCDFDQVPPDVCPRCAGHNLLPEGTGTERLEDELGKHFPDCRIARMDRDTTTAKGAHQRLIDRVMANEVDILVGTQMVAKGHDFPNVTLVGVVDADNSLNFPDFRSAERTFSLLVQVAGRAGRGDKAGRVMVQTWSPEHYALQCAAAHDYKAFYEHEITCREPLGYPPFGYLVNLVVSGNDETKVARAGEVLVGGLQHYGREVEVLGPAPCPLARLRGKTRNQILLKSATRMPLHRLLQYLGPLTKEMPAGVRLTTDVDPVDML
ncbi:MAG: primosomal protein N' [Desulfuromonas sp.]|nr:MAG: primosomal protein N' [Desulfuromonas sp.]